MHKNYFSIGKNIELVQKVMKTIDDNKDIEKLRIMVEDLKYLDRCTDYVLITYWGKAEIRKATKRYESDTVTVDIIDNLITKFTRFQSELQGIKNSGKEFKIYEDQDLIDVVIDLLQQSGKENKSIKFKGALVLLDKIYDSLIELDKMNYLKLHYETVCIMSEKYKSNLYLDEFKNNMLSYMNYIASKP